MSSCCDGSRSLRYPRAALSHSGFWEGRGVPEAQLVSLGLSLVPPDPSEADILSEGHSEAG